MGYSSKKGSILLDNLQSKDLYNQDKLKKILKEDREAADRNSPAKGMGDHTFDFSKLINNTYGKDFIGPIQQKLGNGILTRNEAEKYIKDTDLNGKLGLNLFTKTYSNNELADIPTSISYIDGNRIYRYELAENEYYFMGMSMSYPDIVLEDGSVFSTKSYSYKHTKTYKAQNFCGYVIAGLEEPPVLGGTVMVGPLFERSKTGPKPTGTGPHNQKIADVANSVTDGKVVAGGQQLPEKAINTAGGMKSSRRPDIIVERPDGSQYGINVGKTTKSGAPIKREADAIYDLEGVGFEMHFVPYIK